jgi:hypothetical protein
VVQGFSICSGYALLALHVVQLSRFVSGHKRARSLTPVDANVVAAAMGA